MTIHTTGPQDTEHVGQRLGALCQGTELIGLVGGLGTGKTCFVRGLAAGLGIEPAAVRSPSFTLMSEHHGRLSLFHIDLYRLDTTSIDELWLRECLFDTGVAIVEWFDRLPQPVADEQLRITFRFGDGDERILTVEATGAHHQSLVDAWGLR